MSSCIYWKKVPLFENINDYITSIKPVIKLVITELWNDFALFDGVNVGLLFFDHQHYYYYYHCKIQYFLMHQYIYINKKHFMLS